MDRVEFRAAVLHEVGRPLVVERVSVGDLKPKDVLVRLHASGLCHTDLEVMDGALPYPMPIVLGHEGAGVVDAVGDEVTLVAPGDHVVCSWNPHCGQCFYCERDQPILCEAFTRTQPQGRLLDGDARLRLRGRPLHHFSAVSSHAEYCVVHESSAVTVPREIPFDRACLLGCGVMTGVGAATRVARRARRPRRRGRLRRGGSQRRAGSAAGGGRADRGGGRRRPQAGAGPDARRHPHRQRRSRGRGADDVIEAAGRAEGFQLALEAARPGGTIVFLGKMAVGQPVTFRWGSLMGERRIVRSSYGGARPRRDFPWLARAYLDGRLKLDELITRRLRLDQANDGFAGMVKGDVVRAVLLFDREVRG